MDHPAELAVYAFLHQAMAGNTTISKEIVDQVADDVGKAMTKQLDSGPRDNFRLRMSNIGRPTCQLWFDKNDPVDKIPFPPHFLINMLLGDIVEAVFKGLLRAAGVQFEDNKNVTLDLGNDRTVKGEYDLVLDGKVDDIKSASPWAYKNKFSSFESLNSNDSFGYVSQLVGYATAADKEVGGWWVVNKATGEFKYVTASAVNKEAVLDKIKNVYDYIDNDLPFKRCYEAIPETFYRKLTGNFKLDPNTCGFCSYKHKCWPGLQTLPMAKSIAKEPKLVDYVKVAENEAA